MYVRTLFVDYSSAFITVLPHKLVKLGDLGLPHTTCMWNNSFLSDGRQRVRVGHHTSTALILSTDSPQFYSLYTHDCSPVHHSSHTMVKLDTTVIRLISGGGHKCAYREEVQQLSTWCRPTTLSSKPQRPRNSS